MTVGSIILAIISALLLTDTLYSLYNFEYTFMTELKKRFAQLNNTPIQQKLKLSNEINEEMGVFRILVQATYFIWIIMTIFSHFYLIPIILSLMLFITNIIYKKAYIAPLILLLNLIVFFMCYLFTLLSVFEIK